MSTRIACKLDAPDGLLCRFAEPWSNRVVVGIWLELPSLEAAQKFAKGLKPDCDLVLEIPDPEAKP